MGKSSTSPEAWTGWSAALTKCLEDAGGEMTWPAVQKMLVSSYIKAKGGEASDEMVGLAALASIPEPFLSKDDAMVRVQKRVAEDDESDEAPAPKKAKAAAKEAAPTPSKEKSADAGETSFKLFIKGLPYSVEEASLRKDFEECGEIAQLQLPKNEDGSPKGFAFITYATREGFDAALKFDNTDYGGRSINVSKANDSGKGKGKGKDGGGGGGGDEHQVFIRGLPFSATEESIKKDFAECGEIIRFKLPLNEEGKPKGICFITYKDQSGLDGAVKFDNTDYGGRTINVAKAEGKGKGKGKDDKGKGKGKDDKGKGKGKKGKGKGKAPSESFAKSSGCIVAGAGEKKTFADDSDDD